MLASATRLLPEMLPALQCLCTHRQQIPQANAAMHWVLSGTHRGRLPILEFHLTRLPPEPDALCLRAARVSDFEAIICRGHER